MPSKRFDLAKPFVTLGLVVAAWVAVPFVVKTFMRASFFEFQAPITLAPARVRDLQEYWQLRMHTNNELVEAGRDQGRLISSYEATIRDNAKLLAENERLQRMLNLPPPAGFRAEPARVSRREFTGWWQQMVIQKGRNYGITTNAPVVFSGGLVGRVIEVYAYSAKVELISSPTFRLAASFEEDDRIISFQGGINPTFGQARGTIEGVPVDIYVSPGAPKRLVTSGHGGIFPPGFSLGQVVRLEKGGDGLFASGEVLLDPRLSALNEVTVLVPMASE